MKTIYFLLLVVCYSIASGQKTDTLNSIFILEINFKAKICDGVGNITNGEEILKKGFKFQVDYIADKHYVVSLLPFIKSSEENNKQFVETDNKYLYFLIDKNIFNQISTAIPDRHSLKVGIPTMPIKLRPATSNLHRPDNSFQFESNISLGLTLAYTYAMGSRNQVPVSLLFGVSTTTIPVDSASTGGKINIKTNAAAITPAFGLLMGNNQFSAGVFYGVDYLSGSINNAWAYRNQGWWGIGINYSLFKEGSGGKNID